MMNDNTQKTNKNVVDNMPNLKDIDEVRKAVIASEILQRKW